MYDRLPRLLLGRGLWLLAAILTCTSGAGCTIGYELALRNVDGPDVEVLINGRPVATLPCGAEQVSVIAGLTAPLLPWDVEVRRLDGEGVLGLIHISGDNEPSPRELVVREVGILEIPPVDPSAAARGALPCD
jgi:hypothetical protein